MSNLELHNRLLQVAKKTAELKEKYPQIAPDLEPIEDLTRTQAAAPQPHPVVIRPYHKGDSNAS